MPRFDVKTMSLRERASLTVTENGVRLTRVSAVDTDEGWVEEATEEPRPTGDGGYVLKRKTTRRYGTFSVTTASTGAATASGKA